MARKEVGNYRTGTIRSSSPFYKKELEFGTGSQPYPLRWDGSLQFHNEQAALRKMMSPEYTPILGGGSGDNCSAKTVNRSAGNAKSVSGSDQRKSRTTRG